MIRKFLTITAVTALTASLCSCIESIPKELDLPSESEPQIVTTEPTIPETEPETEPDTEPTTYGAPEPIVLDVKMPSSYEPSASASISGFEAVLQEPELPTGCEVTALTQTLNFYNFGIDKVTLFDTFMPSDTEGEWSMDEVYLGDPRATNGFGCNASVVTRTANSYFASIGSDWYAMNLTGITLKEVFYQVEQGRPVIVWSTIGQRQTHAVYEFTTACGKQHNFNPYQHCLTVTGFDYDAGTVTVADPLAGNTDYNMTTFEWIFDEMGRQAVILCGHEETAGEIFNEEIEQKVWIAENEPKKVDDIYEGEAVKYGLH